VLAFGWWNIGHGFISDAALQHLPPALRSQMTALYGTIRPASTNEPPGQHYIDVDAYPEFFSHTFPRDLNVLIANHGQAFVNSTGHSPWVIGDYLTTLTARMSSAHTNADRLALAQTAGEMAHYIEDIHQPLHTTQNYDGQLTGNFGVHARSEGEMINRHLADLTIAPSPADCVFIPDIVDRVLVSIDTTWSYVDDIMAADTLAAGNPRTFGEMYYDSMWASTGAFTRAQFQDASEMVASAWYSAWVNAGQPTFVPEPASLGLILLTCGWRGINHAGHAGHAGRAAAAR
jgi:hypothetical protein